MGKESTTQVVNPPQKPGPISVAPEGKGFFVVHTALLWDVAGPFRLRQEAFAEVKKRNKSAGVASWAVQLKDLKHPKDKRDPVLMAATEHLAARLQETKREPIETLMSLITVCGLAFLEGVYKETMEIEAKGGMLIKATQPKDVRPRTRGGVFFTLARQKMTPEQQMAIPHWKRQKEAHRKHVELRKKLAAAASVQDGAKEAVPELEKPDQG